MRKIQEKTHRLALSEYRGICRASFTLCIQNHMPIFRKADIANNFIALLRLACKKHHCINWAYVFMPDHAHIILEGANESADLWKCMAFFKQLTGFWLAKNKPQTKWQKDFYDQVHYDKTALLNHILYVVNNPIRKNLVTKWQDYPFTGSLDNDLNAIVWD